MESILQELGTSYCVGQNTRAYGWEMLKTAVEGVAGLQLADMAIKRSLGLGSPGNSQDYAKGLRGLTALHWACKRGHLGVVKLLLASMEDNVVAIRNRFEGRMALHMAILNHSDEVAEVLIQKMRVQDLAIPERSMKRALAMDTFADEQDMESLIGAHRKVIAKIGREGIEKEEGIAQRTALHMAAGFGMANAVQLLLEKLGSSATYTKDQLDGQTALHEAARGGHAEVVRMLLEKGGDDLLTIEDEKQQNTAILYAMGKFCYESAKAKADKVEEDPTTLLAEAKACLDVFIKRMTPEQVAHPNETGATIFHVAASARDDDAIKLILPYVDSKGIMIIDDGGRTALHWAAESGSVQMVSMILAKTDPENLSMKDKGDERTPLQIATVSGYTDIALLLAKKMDVTALSAADASGSTALHIAVRNAHLEIVRSLSELLPSTALAQVDLQSRTPLHYSIIIFAVHAGFAARQSFETLDENSHKKIAALHIEMIELFLAKIENKLLAIRDVEGKTVLHYAFAQKDTVMAKMFVDFFKQRGLMPKDEKALGEISAALMGENGDLAEVLLRRVEGRAVGGLEMGMEELEIGTGELKI
jgi:ankyrin repeat protein